jgi:hypothetical protein
VEEVPPVESVKAYSTPEAEWKLDTKIEDKRERKLSPRVVLLPLQN